MCAAVPSRLDDDGAGWVARLALGFERRGERTVLARRAHVGPLRVQRALYPEGGAVCHALIVHPPGGVVGGDLLALDVAVEPGAAALVTTPAATKLYRSAGPLARLVTRLRVDGALEHLPQETIAFAGCRARADLTVELGAGARYLGWEVTALGRPAAGDHFADGALDQRVTVTRAGVPLFRERATHVGGSERLAARWGLGGHRVLGTLLAVGAAGDLDAVRAALATHVGPDAAAATRLDADVVLARYRGDDPRAALAAFEAVRAVLRPALVGRPAIAPRIWAT